MTTLPDSDLRELEGLVEKRETAGPWGWAEVEEDAFDPIGGHYTRGSGNALIWSEAVDETNEYTTANHVTDECYPRDAALIVAAVNALPSLIADLREARERLAEIDRAKAKECWPSPDGKHNVRGNVCIYCRRGENFGEGWGGGSGARIKELEGKT